MLYDRVLSTHGSIMREKIKEALASNGKYAQLSHVFQNLLSNTLKYRHVDRPLQIDIKAHKRETDWVDLGRR